ncbi:phosphatase 2C-like domain-containing protein, partial [Scenedesmus sp. NREL 46B-D3]
MPLLAAGLTLDHTPSRADEADRIQKAGGQILVNPATPNGKLRVRGELEVTRSFGDLGFQDQGVVPDPEFAAHTLQPGDAFLVLASDGVFEALTTDEVC